MRATLIKWGWLWIAFKNYYLRDEEQPTLASKLLELSCELLSKIIIFVMKNNEMAWLHHRVLVVNCFQKLLSSWWRTTNGITLNTLNKLWIAFKNYYLRDEEQPYSVCYLFKLCCELLSKIIIFVMKNNLSVFRLFVIVVVNCFQKLLSSWWRTTLEHLQPYRVQLWIAFKNYYLRDEEQHFSGLQLLRQGCELLSKIIIFVMKNNLSVVCFVVIQSCELLSKIIIFVMKNNQHWLPSYWNQVVNCFQKLLSSWWRTTIFFTITSSGMLWIAFKNYYLRDEEQRLK